MSRDECREPWFDTVASEVRYEGLYVTVRLDEVRMPDGHISEREVVEQTEAAAVVPILDDERVILLRQYRHAVGRYVLEIPAGKLDKNGESPEECAGRELVEETGHRAAHLEHAITFLNSAGWTDETTHVYVATDLSYEGQPDDFDPSGEEADMEVVILPLHEAAAGARGGSIVDAKTVIGLLLAAGR